MRKAFTISKMRKSTLQFLEMINEIITSYEAQGYTLTLRQLYYQLVSRAIIANNDKQYSKLSRTLTDARMSGLVDWNAIEDRVRIPKRLPHWNHEVDFLDSVIPQFALDKMRGQENLIEVWVEKDALSQVVQRSANKYHLRTLVNRGYGSVSVMYDAYNRFKSYSTAKILYIGDHDPSGLDMIRDIRDRIGLMLDYDTDTDFEVIPVALTMEQIKKYDPPVNPAKLTDTRAADYIANHGVYSWEVDALEPKVLSNLIETEIEKHININMFERMREKEVDQRQRLEDFKDNFKN